MNGLTIVITTDKKQSCAAPYPAPWGDNIFIYCNIVDYEPVRDSYVCFLKSINITDGKHKIHTSYNKLHYTSPPKQVINGIKKSE